MIVVPVLVQGIHALAIMLVMLGEMNVALLKL
jgi:hypothetical protein